VSPELLTDKLACKSSDLWALGCIIYQLLAGLPPFHAVNEYQCFQKITKLEYQFPDGFPEAGADLVQKLLVSIFSFVGNCQSRVDGKAICYVYLHKHSVES
jgi:3-phosphoinositide dependent protein kinase-1